MSTYLIGDILIEVTYGGQQSPNYFAKIHRTLPVKWWKWWTFFDIINEKINMSTMPTKKRVEYLSAIWALVGVADKIGGRKNG